MLQSIHKNIFMFPVRREISELYVSIAIKALACSMIAVFEPVFLYKIFNSIERVVFFYLIVYLANFFLLPLGGKLASKCGFEHCIMYSIPFVIIYLFILYQIKSHHALYWIAPLILASYKTIYWPAQHTDMAHYGNSRQRGAEVSFYYFLNAVINIIGPLAGGFIIAFFGFKALFAIASAILFMSAIPLFTSNEKFEAQDFSYVKAMKRFFKPYATYTRRAEIAFLGLGADFIGMICWPIFIFLVIGDYRIMGALVTLSLLVTAIATLLIGKAIDKRKGDMILKGSVILYFFIWIFRYFFPTTAGVFAVDFLDRNFGNGIFLPFRTYTFEEGKKRGHLKFIVFSEMGLAFAKVLAAAVLLLALHYINSWFVIFFIAGVFSLFFLFLPVTN
ncbi:hypothetical protein A2Y83_00365 [Candidatus Falkowbacteria bacterium RBG_13_39_14]|uniref:Major facilitator superfamily (MFS) profile domain-containing protein n=1 Tax=Candidatus Falkowbacteria bacterium RBG_13_39_14 TaxID=1797985 RepID=A0A1F5S7F8_9BACT|nr:MAG: hypothetical protein A2Y83_00365 [Candidatus Falkowbacteria bacterium RBG_13_39_14]